VIPNASAPGAFAVPEAEFDFFATEAHYRSLAGRILDAVGGFSIVVDECTHPLRRSERSGGTSSSASPADPSGGATTGCTSAAR
jgi:hypothetical protein